jgi:hypothetical protein
MSAEGGPGGRIPRLMVPGVVEPRGMSQPVGRLQEPRAAPARDFIALERRRLLEESGTRRQASGDRQKATPSHTPPEGGASTLSTLPYRYTRGIETVNDEMGYGERVETVFWAKVDGELIVEERVAQRTKSGRQDLPRVTMESEED